MTDAVVTNAAVEREPVAALVAGGILGALAFALSALFLGAVTGIEIAVAAAAASLVRGRFVAAMIFAVSALFSAGTLAFAAISIIWAALAFGAGLATVARSRRPVAINDQSSSSQS